MPGRESPWMRSTIPYPLANQVERIQGLLSFLQGVVGDSCRFVQVLARHRVLEFVRARRLELRIARVHNAGRKEEALNNLRCVACAQTAGLKAALCRRSCCQVVYVQEIHGSDLG